jgi:hypothetical protein
MARYNRLVMRRYDASNAECLVFTFKEGLASALAHDLKLRVTDFAIEVDEERHAVEARFAPRSLRVVCAMAGGRESPGALAANDHEKIEENIVRDVLEADRYPEIRFSSAQVARETGGYRVVGSLALHGRAREVSLVVREEAGRLVTEVELHQPDFGIRPYSALFGALKVRPDVKLRVSVAK